MPEKNYPSLKRHFELELKRLCALEDTVKVFIADGAPHIWNYKSQTRLLDDWLEILDYYHATEQLNVLAESLFGKDSPQAKTWYRKYADLLLAKNHAAENLFRSAKYNFAARNTTSRNAPAARVKRRL